jgi:hypothetical protein
MTLSMFIINLFLSWYYSLLTRHCSLFWGIVIFLFLVCYWLGLTIIYLWLIINIIFWLLWTFDNLLNVFIFYVFIVFLHVVHKKITLSTLLLILSVINNFIFRLLSTSIAIINRRVLSFMNVGLDAIFFSNRTWFNGRYSWFYWMLTILFLITYFLVFKTCVSFV